MSQVQTRTERCSAAGRLNFRSRTRWRVPSTFVGLAFLSLSASLAAAAQEPGVTSATTAAAPSHAQPARTNGLEERVQLLTKELDLDPGQQASVRAILLAQRTEVIKAWSDPTVPAAARVGTTQAISA